MSRFVRVALGIALTLSALYLIAALLCPAAFDYSESDVATWVWLLRHGQAIWGAPDPGLPMLRTNYPPIYLRLVAVLAGSDASILSVARLVSLAGFAATAALIGCSARAATGSRRAGVLAALLFAATHRANYFATVGRADMLGLSLGSAAVTLVALRVRGWPVLAALAFAASLLTKHSLVVFPVGVGLWALWRLPRAGACFGALLAGILGLAVWRLGLFEPLARWSRAPWSLSVFARYFVEGVAPSLLGIILAAKLVRRLPALPERARSVLEPWAVVFLVGLLWTLSLGRHGSDVNYVLELVAALSVLAAAAAHLEPRPGPGPRPSFYQRWFAAHVAVTTVETAAWAMALVLFVLPRARAQEDAARAALQQPGGPVLAETTWHAIAAGRQPLVIPFLSSQLVASGVWSGAPLEEAAMRGEIESVLLSSPVERAHPDRFTPGTIAALKARYVLAGTWSGLYVYRPR